MSSPSFQLPGGNPFEPYHDRNRAPSDATRSPIGRPRRVPRSNRPEAKLEPAEAELLEFEAAEPKPDQALLTHPRWDREEVRFGDVVFAQVDVELPESMKHLTRVDFELLEEDSGDRPPLKASGTIQEGVASAGFQLVQPVDPETNQLIPRSRFRFSAKHSKSDKVEGPALVATAGDQAPFDGALFYSPAKKEYLVCETQDELKALLDNAGTLGALRDRSQKAWKMIDAEKRHAALQQVAEEAKQLFGGKSTGDARRGFEELILVQQNKTWGEARGWSYIAVDDPEGETQAGFPKRYPPEKVQGMLDKLLKRGPKEDRQAEAWKGKFKLNLFETEPISGQAWGWRTPKEKEDPNKPPMFRQSTEAALARFMCNWDGASIGYDPAKQKLDIGTSGKVSGSLFEGKLDLKWELPAADGINILAFLSKVKNKDIYLVNPDRKCLVKVALEGAISAFVGVTVQGSLGLQLERVPKEEAKAEAAVMGGGQVAASAKGSILWTRHGSVKYGKVGHVGYDASLSVGVGGKAGIRIGYDKGRFYFEMDAGATWGIGGGGGWKWEVDAKEAIKIIGHLFDCVNFHFVTEVTADAHRAYTNYSYAYHVAQVEQYKRQAEWANESHEAFSKWLEQIKPKLKDIKWTLFNSSLSKTMLASVPPQALAQSIRTIMVERQKDDFRTIMNLLNSTVTRRYDPTTNPTANHKLKWVLRFLPDSSLPEKLGVDESDSEVVDWKKSSLQKGIDILLEFGWGRGNWAGQEYSKENESFVNEIDEMIISKGVLR